jgi:hypothetical protein
MARKRASATSFSSLGDDMISEILYRTPVYAHDGIESVCKAFNNIVRAGGEGEFFMQRAKRGLTEPVMLAFGGVDCGGYGRFHKCMLALIEGEWVYCANMPVWGSNLYHGMLFDHLVLVGGGQLTRDEYLPDGGLIVHAYDIVADEWYQFDFKDDWPAQRIGAACASDGNSIVIAGGEIHDPNDDDDEYARLTNTVLELRASNGPKNGSLRLGWNELPPMPTAVHGQHAFFIDERFYVIGTEQLGEQREKPLMQVLDRTKDEWSVCSKLPEDATLNAGAVHSGRFYCLAGLRGWKYEEGGIWPTLYAYDPQADVWETKPELPTPTTWDNESYGGRFRWSSNLSLTACVSGLMVLDEEGGEVALMKIVDGGVTSVVTLCNEHWGERISRFAQDHGLRRLNAACFEMSAHCRALLKEWAERIEDKQQNEEEMWEPDDDEDAECGPPEMVENLHAAKLWLRQKGLPDAHERHRLWREELEKRNKAMSEEDKIKEVNEAIKKFHGWD